MSEFEESEDDLSSLEVVEGHDDVETFGYANQTKHSEIPVEAAMALQKTRDRVRSITTDEFIAEAVESASMLRNTLGDADGVVADQCNNIISNLSVLATEIQKDPVGFLLSFARAIEDVGERVAWADQVSTRLAKFSADTAKLS